MKKLNYEKLLKEHCYPEWIGNKSFNQNIIEKLNEIIDCFNNLNKK